MTFLFQPNLLAATKPSSFSRLLNLADQLVETAAKAKYTGELAACGIDSDFLTRLRVKVLQATLNPTPEYGLLTEVAAMCLQIQISADSISLAGQKEPAEVLSDFKIVRS
jgi:hypothetical protein